MKGLIAILCSALLLTGCAENLLMPVSPEPLKPLPLTKNRYWTGSAYQNTTQTSWTMAGYIIPGETSRMTYPTLKCAGKWSYMGMDSGSRMKYQENIYRDPQARCLRTVNLSVKPVSDTELEYVTYTPNGKVDSRGTLRAAEVPLPRAMEGTWSAMGKTLTGDITEVQVRLSRTDRSMLHHFANACTYDLFFAQSTGTSIAMDRGLGKSEVGNVCDAEVTMGFSLRDKNTLLVRTYNGSRVIDEVLMKRL